MAYAFVTQIKNVRKHSNADRLNVGECFGNQVIVSLETQEGDAGIYFATDSQLGEKYAEVNDLVRRKDADGNNVGGYLEPDKRNIRALKLRGETSDGLFMPLSSLDYVSKGTSFKLGDCVDMVNGEMIAQKYFPKRNAPKGDSGNFIKKVAFKEKEYPLFQEHADTSQYAYNKHAFKVGDVLNISLKLHGTSGRTSNALVRKYTKPTFINKLLMKIGKKVEFEDSYELVSGTRRTVLKNYEGGFYESNGFRRKYHNLFEGKLRKGETIYYEIVGYTETGEAIMSSCSNDKVGDKEFAKKYGKTTEYSYGCAKGESEIYVYRMTYTSETGEVFEYPTWLVKTRCEEMNINTVPTLATVIFSTIEELDAIVNELSDGVDPIGLTHIREGVVIRVENRARITAYKHKNIYFKILEGIIKDNGVLDIEEQESAVE